MKEILYCGTYRGYLLNLLSSSDRMRYREESTRIGNIIISSHTCSKTDSTISPRKKSVVTIGKKKMIEKSASFYVRAKLQRDIADKIKLITCRWDL